MNGAAQVPDSDKTGDQTITEKTNSGQPTYILVPQQFQTIHK